MHAYIHTYIATILPTRSFTTSFVFPSFPVPAKTIETHFRKKLTCGVIRSFNFSFQCILVVFPQTVYCWGTQFYLKVCPPCVRGCVRLRTICLPTHLSPNSFVSQVLCQGLCPPPGDLSPNSQFICLPIHVSPNSFVSQVLCQGLCPPPGDLSPNSFVRLVSGAVSASGRFVSQFICLPIHLSPRSLSPNSFVSQVLWQGLCPLPGDWFPNSFVSQFICLPGPVSGAVSAFGGFVSQFVCLPSFPKQLSVGVLHSILRCVRLVSGAVSASLGSVSPISPQTVYCWRSQFSFKRCPAMFRWWCLALRMSRIHLSPYINSFVSQSGWWCPALRLSPIHLSPLVATHLSPNLAVGVRLWLCPIHLSCLVATHLSPSLAGGVRLFGCLSHAGDVRLFGCL